MAAVPKKNSSVPAECPVCGADVPRNARACPACGADERTGWNEDDIRYDGLDLPENAFDDDDVSPRPKRASAPSPRINGLALHWWLIALVLLAILVLGAVSAFPF